MVGGNRLTDPPARDSGNGRLVVFTVLIAVFADNTAAYFVGRTIGRHKIAPKISPGVVGSDRRRHDPAMAARSSRCTTGTLTNLEALALGAAIAFSWTLSDLFESAIKRAWV